MGIEFGTDGWRAVISEDFTFANVRRVAQAIAKWVHESGTGSEPAMVVGFDTRFLSDRYAIEVARVLAGNGIRVHLTRADAPTPVDLICDCTPCGQRRNNDYGQPQSATV